MGYFTGLLGALSKVVDLAVPAAKGSRTAIAALVITVCPVLSAYVPSFTPYCPLVDGVAKALLPVFALAHIGRE